MNEAQHRAYLDKHKYQKFTEEDMAMSKELLEQEMIEVKDGMGHGDLSLEAYTQVNFFTFVKRK